jgi:hypothetical protein
MKSPPRPPLMMSFFVVCNDQVDILAVDGEVCGQQHAVDHMGTPLVWPGCRCAMSPRLATPGSASTEVRVKRRACALERRDGIIHGVVGKDVFVFTEESEPTW